MVNNKICFLSRSFLFSSADPRNLSKIASVASLRSFQKNETIFQEGEEARGFFIVVEGKVKVYKLSFAGDEHILHVVGEGGSFAEAAVFGTMARYPAFAEAIEPTQMIFFPRAELLAVLRSDFSLTQAVISSLVEKLKYFNALVEGLSLKSGDARVAKYLLDLSFKKKTDHLTLDLKKIELARKLGLAPETLSRIFRKLKKQRIIRLDQAKIFLCDQKRLQAISSGEDA